MKNYIYISILLAMVFVWGCSDHQHTQAPQQAHAHAGNSVTLYTDATETFMEYPQLIVNHDARFLIHLTDLKDFKAVTDGILTIEFKNQSGTKVVNRMESPTRDGIYVPTIKFAEPGNYLMKMELSGNQVSDIIWVKNVMVYASENDMPHVHEEESDGISFLKEQQWKIDFANEAAKIKAMQSSVKATGIIQAKPENYSKIVSPVNGIILADKNSNIKSVGTFVKKGARLLNISPAADAGKNIIKIKNDYLLAKTEFERAEKLYAKKAISRKRFDIAKSDFVTKKSGYKSLSRQIKFTEKGYTVLAPITGYIESINFRLGEQVESGQELFTIINPERLRLQANVRSSHIEKVENTNDAAFKIEGFNSIFKISELNGKRVGIGSSLDQTSRTLPVYFEFENKNNKIKAGLHSEVYVKTGEEKEVVAIPLNAIVNEDGLKTVYVQLEGELFEKRIVKTGIVEDGYVQIISGIKNGERVVTTGAYQVRLTALSPDKAIGEGHVH